MSTHATCDAIYRKQMCISLWLTGKILQQFVSTSLTYLIHMFFNLQSWSKRMN